MFIYEGVICPYCKKELKPEDIITVCPECGTPHHYDCYKEHGECANAKKHEKGFEWSADKVSISRRTVTCPRCGRENAEEGRFCNYCGFEYKSGSPTEERRSVLGGIQQEYGEMLFRNDEGELEEIPPEEKIDGIAARDWASYIGTSANYYLYYFKSQLETGKKTAFTLSAAIFPTVYFCYRKIWWLAAVAAVAEIVLAIPTALTQYLIPMGIPVMLPTALLETAASICSVLLLALHLVYGLFAVYIYRLSAKKQILKLRSESRGEAEFKEKLKLRGGPSVLAVQILLGVLFFITSIATFLMIPTA